MDSVRQKLSANLLPVYDLETSLGNGVVRVDEPAGTQCLLAVVFVQPLHKTQLEAQLKFSPTVFWHENLDPHYERDGMAGYFCDETHHFVYGPIVPTKNLI